MVVFIVENRNADLEREVTVQFTTIEASATGRCICLMLLCHEVMCSYMHYILCKPKKKCMVYLSIQLDLTSLLQVES